MSVADSDQHVVVRLGDSSHHSEERLFGAGLRRNAGLTPVAVSQRLCLDRLGVDIRDSLVLGDSIWDMIAAQRARGLGVGLLSGGYGEEELARAGAFRVYEDPADLLRHIDEVAARS